MKIAQWLWNAESKWTREKASGNDFEAQLVLFFAPPSLMRSMDVFAIVKDKFPEAQILGCSGSGEILDEEIFDNCIVASALTFEKGTFKVSRVKSTSMKDSYDCGKKIGTELYNETLRGLFIISEGLQVNGSELVRGIKEKLPHAVPVTGGLAGDGPDFNDTRVACNSPAENGVIGAIGFYGDEIVIGHGSVGGWEGFGPARRVTKADGNILYELDKQPALDLYKKYLGEEEENLPGSALLFPLKIQRRGQDHALVRTVLSIDEEKNSMTFAGDIPEGSEAQLMRANFERLIDGAESAAKLTESPPDEESLAILISCVGRRMVLGQRAADEVEAVKEILGEKAQTMGFYSYGEISPHVKGSACELHNQTMTITTIWERSDA